MNAIKLNFTKTNDDLFGKSKWWGAPDLPEDWEYPVIDDDEGSYPLTFLCQIRCADLAKYDTKNLLPHEGMLYFFACIDEYFDDDEHDYQCPYFNKYGEWDRKTFKVLYSPTTDNLSTYEIFWEDDAPAYKTEVEAITFSIDDSDDDDSSEFYLLGAPSDPDVLDQCEDYINLLQVDEEDRWDLSFVDCGILNFLITPEDLKNRNFENAIVYLVYY